MVNVYEIFPTEEAAEAFMFSYYRSYDPAGYGTRLDLLRVDDGQWVVKGYRWSSCD